MRRNREKKEREACKRRKEEKERRKKKMKNIWERVEREDTMKRRFVEEITKIMLSKVTGIRRIKERR